VRLGTKVTDLYDGVDGVVARLADGTVEKGDMVIGCDGVHSLTRESMWDEGNREVPGLITVQEKKCNHILLTGPWTNPADPSLRSCIDRLVVPDRNGAHSSRHGRSDDDMRP